MEKHDSKTAACSQKGEWLSKFFAEKLKKRYSKINEALFCVNICFATHLKRINHFILAKINLGQINYKVRNDKAFFFAVKLEYWFSKNKQSHETFENI